MKKLLYAIFLALFIKFLYITYSPGTYPNYILMQDGSHFWIGWNIKTPAKLTEHKQTNLTEWLKRPYSGN